MHQLDERILEAIHSDGMLAPEHLATRVEFSPSEARVRERCRWLAYAGLLEPIHADLYDLTSWGKLYLAGDLDAAHQPVPNDDRARV